MIQDFTVIFLTPKYEDIRFPKLWLVIFHDMPANFPEFIQGTTYICFPIMVSLYHRIGWWEILQETPIFDGKNHGFRLRFSLKPIHWLYNQFFSVHISSSTPRFPRSAAMDFPAPVSYRGRPRRFGAERQSSYELSFPTAWMIENHHF